MTVQKKDNEKKKECNSIVNVMEIMCLACKKGYLIVQ